MNYRRQLGGSITRSDSQQSITSEQTDPPDYIWAVAGEFDHCLSFDWLEGQRYRVRYERRHSRAATIGAIQFEATTGKWAIARIGTTDIHPGEAFAYDGWEAAARWLYEQHLEQKRSRVKSALLDG